MFGEKNWLLRFPEFDGVSFRIIKAREAAVGVFIRVGCHFDARVAQLKNHGIQVMHAEVDHPYLAGIAKVLGILAERCENSWASFLMPGLGIVAFWHQGDAEMFLVPLRLLRWCISPEKQPADSGNFFS